MEILGSLLLVLLVVALFELAAVLWGTDSRPGVDDDHRRSVS
jgi:hypothetical protein